MIKKFEEFINETISPSWKNKSHSWQSNKNNIWSRRVRSLAGRTSERNENKKYGH